jgi:hypothetical protein
LKTKIKFLLFLKKKIKVENKNEIFNNLENLDIYTRMKKKKKLKMRKSNIQSFVKKKFYKEIKYNEKK